MSMTFRIKSFIWSKSYILSPLTSCLLIVLTASLIYYFLRWDTGWINSKLYQFPIFECIAKSFIFLIYLLFITMVMEWVTVDGDNIFASIVTPILILLTVLASYYFFNPKNSSDLNTVRMNVLKQLKKETIQSKKVDDFKDYKGKIVVFNKEGYDNLNYLLPKEIRAFSTQNLSTVYLLDISYKKTGEYRLTHKAAYNAVILAHIYSWPNMAYQGTVDFSYPPPNSIKYNPKNKNAIVVKSYYYRLATKLIEMSALFGPDTIFNRHIDLFPTKVKKGYFEFKSQHELQKLKF